MSGSFSSRSVLATWLRLLPTICATSSWVWLNCVDQRLIAGRLFERIEVGALHVLDDGEFERLRVGRLDHDDRHVVQAGALRRAPAPLAGDDLELVRRAAHGAHDDRLDDAALADRGGQLVEFGLGEGAARIARIGARDSRSARGAACARLAARPAGDSSPTSPISAARPRPSRDRSSAIAATRRHLPIPLHAQLARAVRARAG